MSPSGRLGFGVLLGLAGAGLLAFALYQVGHATGLLGVRGTLTVNSCATVGTGKGSHIACTGPFRSDNGRSDATEASVQTNPALAAGKTLRVDQVHPGSYVRISVSRAEGWLAATALALMILASSGAALTNWSRGEVVVDTHSSRANQRFGLAIALSLLCAALFGGASAVTSLFGN